ncbi:DNA mismatch endonuclease (patch repair protein) [Arthrobacter sp. CAN_A214]|uniref:very short patch repair endonuclease n=1 Tax=Arthrobacter sp. CAN_A214 TaxID=2787720 RepID=UPI0018CA449D
MTDRLTPEQRSANMSKIRAANTKPEMQVRRMVHREGYRYVLYDKRLPGTPDLVFPGRRKVIFVHGCFWHQHTCRAGQYTPKTNAEFWSAKRQRNVDRDNEQLQKLEELGWKTYVVWECKLKQPDEVLEELALFLS